MRTLISKLVKLSNTNAEKVLWIFFQYCQERRFERDCTVGGQENARKVTAKLKQNTK
jgi:hypothetical protein